MLPDRTDTCCLEENLEKLLILDGKEESITRRRRNWANDDVGSRSMD